MKLKNQGKGLGGLLFLSFFLAPGVQAKAPEAAAKADVSWYANINRALMHVDDGHQKDTYFVDNFSKSSRAGITGETKLDENLSVGGKLELELMSANTYSVNQLNKNASSTTGESAHDGIKIRQVDTWLKSDFGQLSLGHGNTASWTAVASDLSGTADTVGYVGPFCMAGGMYFHKKDNTNPLDTVHDPLVKEAFSPYDGFARQSRVRYDSPTFAGFTLSASMYNGGPDRNKLSDDAGTINYVKYGSDAALRYSSNFKDVDVLGAIAFSKMSRGSDDRNQKIWDASLAALHKDTGINFARKTLASDSELGNVTTKKPTFSRVQLGLIKDLNHYGSTNFVVDYSHTKHALADDAKGKGYGIGVVQQLKKVNSEVYFAVRKLKYEQIDQKYDNMLAAMAGIRVSFGGKLS